MQKKLSNTILEIEKKWQKIWDQNQFFNAYINNSKKKYYCLSMFPYPSGNLHIGHIRNYTIGDAIAIRKRLEGFNVLNPIGWDAFGLPAENAAIQQQIHPLIWTEKNIQNMKSQLIKMGYSYDWSREIKTCDPEYYKWQQLFFLMLFKKGMVYRKKDNVNWCIQCQTVLANEQVEKEQCWRCQSKVIQKSMKQWFIKITNYADQLLDYSNIDEWPNRVLVMQKNWIGQNIGLNIYFSWNNKKITIFTTRPETIYGVTFLALSYTHPIIEEILKTSSKKKELLSFINSKQAIDPESIEKYGVFTGEYAIHPLTQEKIPIFIANFVLSNYATGALMGVPAHDQRDFLFAKKYDLKIKVVIQNPNDTNFKDLKNAYTDPGMMINSNQYSNLTHLEAKEKITEYIVQENLGEKKIFYRLKDWLISRQRYWGAPIPIIYCESCGILPANEEDLPVLLPIHEKLSPLNKEKDFLNCICPSCKNPAIRETDTMDTFICSSWYFLRFTSLSKNQPFSPNDIQYWLPVDQYIGGIEHAILHLLYARFFTKVLKDMDYIEINEPFKSLLTQGMVTNKSYFSLKQKRFLSLEEIKNKKIKKEDLKITLDKMSKSKKNGVDPEPIIQKYGSDTLRLFILFAAPVERDLEWNEKSLQGAHRFILKFYIFSKSFMKYLKSQDAINQNELNKISVENYSLEDYKNLSKYSEAIKKMIFLLHQLISKVNLDFKRYHFNTVISSCMEFSNYLEDFRVNTFYDLILFKISIEILSKLLFPIIPHTTEEVHSQLGFNESIYQKSLPIYFEELLIQDQILYIIQINGITRYTKSYSYDISKEDLIEDILKDDKIKKWLPEKKDNIEKYIFVPKKILNIVIQR